MKSLFLIFFFVITFQVTNYNCHASPIKMAFIAKREGHVLVAKGCVDEQNSPCSTFKIALALMGFDAGILQSKHAPKWAFQKAYENRFESWYKPKWGKKMGWYGEHTPETYMQKSVLWFSHQITQSLGKEKFQKYIDRLDYGNKDISGTPGQNDGLCNSWLGSSLKISPQEQVRLLEKMLATSLDLSRDAQIKTKGIMRRKDATDQAVSWQGWALFGKTGGGQGVHRWFVGWIEKGESKIVFAQYIGLTRDTPAIRARAPMALDIAKKNIEKLLKQM